MFVSARAGMGELEREDRQPLASCIGFGVEAVDGRVGTIETPLFPADRTVPDFLVVRVRNGPYTRTSVVPAALVRKIDLDERLVYVAARRADVLRMPERLPVGR